MIETPGDARMTIPKAIVIAAVLLGAAIILSSFVLRPDHRFQIVTGGPGVSSWRIDQVTGTVWSCGGGACKQNSELSN
jgi:hypothetical protein